VIEINGLLEMTPKGFGFLRIPEANFEQAKEDIQEPAPIGDNHGQDRTRLDGDFEGRILLTLKAEQFAGQDEMAG
jgi:hypothetical protein